MEKLLLILSVLFVVSCSSGEDTASEKYTLTVNINPSDGGSVNPNGGTVSAGEQITLTQTPNNNFVFKDWSGAASGNADSVTIIMDSNKTVNANFNQIIVVESNGTIKCPNAKVGDKETINGKEYEVVDKSTLINLYRNEKDISCLCTTLITDMKGLLFSLGGTVRMKTYAKSFNQDIGNWDTSNVINMENMLQGLHSFNQDISKWDVSKVTNMNAMFAEAKSFNQPIGNWDVSKVTNMNAMFSDTEMFNQPIENWNIENVTTMNSMFWGALRYNQPLNNWKVNNVTDMSYMFWQSAFNQPTKSWNTGNVTTMNSMFYQSSFNQDIGSWDVSKVADMVRMFYEAASFNQDLTKWCVTNFQSEPGDFSLRSALVEANKPKWGTCPSN